MRWLSPAHAARLAAASLCLFSLTGCPELNHWSGPSQQDAFLSVPDETYPRSSAARRGDKTPARESEAIINAD